MREFNELSIIEEKSKLHSEFHSYICKNTFKFREFRNERPIVFFFFFFKDKKHQEDQAARNVNGRSLIRHNFRRDVLGVTVEKEFGEVENC